MVIERRELFDGFEITIVDDSRVYSVIIFDGADDPKYDQRIELCAVDLEHAHRIVDAILNIC